MLLALGFQAFSIGRDSCLDLGNQLLLPLLELDQLVDNAALGALEIVRPGRQTCFHLLLRDGQSLTELVGCRTRALRRGSAPLLGDAALLLRQQGHGVGARARERPLELGAPVVRLLGDKCMEAGLRTRQLVVDATGCAEQRAQLHGDERGRERNGHPARGNRKARLRSESEAHPGSGCSQTEQFGEPYERTMTDPVEHGAPEGQHGQRRRCGEDDLDDGDELHGVRLRGARQGRWPGRSRTRREPATRAPYRPQASRS